MTRRGRRPTHLVVLPLGYRVARRRLTHRWGLSEADVVGTRMSRERRKPGLFVFVPYLFPRLLSTPNLPCFGFYRESILEVPSAVL